MTAVAALYLILLAAAIIVPSEHRYSDGRAHEYTDRFLAASLVVHGLGVALALWVIL